MVQRYSNNKIKDDTSVASEYVKFLASNSGFDGLKALEDKLAKLLSDQKMLSSQVKQISDNWDKYTSSVDLAVKRVQQLEKDVKSLQNKK